MPAFAAMTNEPGSHNMEAGKPDRSTSSAAERAFYRAFADCDPQAMAAVWGQGEVVCVHPGAVPVIGREAVLRSWSGILEGVAALNLRVVLRSRSESGDLAVHLVEEHIAPAAGAPATLVLATNVYRRGEDGWRLQLHHASVPAGADRSTLQ
ncbi:MAG: DUF4440 domain-containing protein [Gammaproteobacteria bacterium]|nr:DUF4440 domain-containing protein [Gammaproteobacteria bacterium]